MQKHDRVKWPSFFSARPGKRNLRDYVRLVIGYFASLILLAVYQQVRLFEFGVLDSFLNGNLWLLLVHHLGFTALVAFFFAFVFKGIEKKRPGWGFRTAAGFFVALLLLEVLLTEYFIRVFDLAGRDFVSQLGSVFSPTQMVLTCAISLVMLGTVYRLSYRFSKRFYRAISGMYPFTIVLFSLFLATLWSDRKPVNRNKVEHVGSEFLQALTAGEAYEGSDPNPFYGNWTPPNPLGPYIQWQEEPPHVVVLLVEGLSRDFVGEDAPLRAFTPFLDSLRNHSLFWENYLSNARESSQAPLLVSGSLPMGPDGFMDATNSPNRMSLFSLLRKNGYRTSFQYGGNASLNDWDRFLYEERLDELTDRKAFGNQYNLQDTDAAGNSLGYPDEELFHRYLGSLTPGSAPRLDILQTLSASGPYLIPDADTYVDRVERIRTRGSLDARQRRIVRKNRELFAAIAYTDHQIRKFIEAFSELPAFSNTLLIIAGTHRPLGLPASEPLDQYRVPLMVYSPMLKGNRVFDKVASHLDVAPSVLGSLSHRYDMEMPARAAWMGVSLLPEPSGHADKPIPLYRDHSGLRGIILGNNVYLDGREKELHTGLEPGGAATHTGQDPESLFRFQEAAERYVLENNALIPESAAPYDKLIREPGKKDLVWIHSVFSGSDLDKAYDIARDLAFEGRRDRARLLCEYILTRVPGHVDSEILLGRIHAWEGDYKTAEDILQQVVQKYPVYQDGYSALLDVYFWSGQHQKAQYLEPAIKANLGGSNSLKDKIDRAQRLLSQNQH